MGQEPRPVTNCTELNALRRTARAAGLTTGHLCEGEWARGGAI